MFSIEQVRLRKMDDNSVIPIGKSFGNRQSIGNCRMAIGNQSAIVIAPVFMRLSGNAINTMFYRVLCQSVKHLTKSVKHREHAKRRITA